MSSKTLESATALSRLGFPTRAAAVVVEEEDSLQTVFSVDAAWNAAVSDRLGGRSLTGSARATVAAGMGISNGVPHFGAFHSFAPMLGAGFDRAFASRTFGADLITHLGSPKWFHNPMLANGQGESPTLLKMPGISTSIPEMLRVSRDVFEKLS